MLRGLVARYVVEQAGDCVAEFPQSHNVAVDFLGSGHGKERVAGGVSSGIVSRWV